MKIDFTIRNQKPLENYFLIKILENNFLISLKMSHPKKFKKSIFIFRRSFRIEDNTALYNALKYSEIVIPVFIFTPEQVTSNPYKSNNAVQFMCDCIRDVDQKLRKLGSKLHIFYGKINNILQTIVDTTNADCIFLNVDYTPYSRKRDINIVNLCKSMKISCCRFEDILLLPVGSVKTAQSTVYHKYTPYWNAVSKIKVQEPQYYKYKNFEAPCDIPGIIDVNDINKFYKNNSIISGSRDKALRILQNVCIEQKNYDKNRDLLTYETTKLSAYIKFGCVSIREVYKAFKSIKGTTLIKQLYWRDFYYNILWEHPKLLEAGNNKSLNSKYDKIKWQNNPIYFKAWCKGMTGYPVVDAAMRQMNKTGYMHNRGRLIVSNFLVKVLFVDWRHGEKYFAQKLVDYDPAVNNGNWQWSAGTGADSQPYFRVFNPYLQSKKFDPDGDYIKKWVPELSAATIKELHADCDLTKYNYPKKIVDYNSEKSKAQEFYKKIL